MFFSYFIHLSRFFFVSLQQFQRYEEDLDIDVADAPDADGTGGEGTETTQIPQDGFCWKL
jgi:hypothetical protein